MISHILSIKTRHAQKDLQFLQIFWCQPPENSFYFLKICLHSLCKYNVAQILNFLNRESGTSFRIKTALGKPVDLPEGFGKFVVVEYLKAAQFRGQNIGDAYKGILTPADGNPVEVLLPLHFPKFDRMRKGALVISVADQKAAAFNFGERSEQRYYTGLQVTKDPGVWLVYAGFIIMIIGCYITFFMSHQRVCIEIVKGKSKSRVIVTGTANKNKTGMQQRVKKLSDKLAQL